ncbi:hypothetical protein PQE68_gp046 [Bacillus phage vB_BanS_Sophrita]|uniref:Uncharacterized protein n=1 Tax=Bacillus phage vB_BanS_Sophrita TaxID=2894790 RepID=A0AAE8YXJ3_9CAUD|nr:hypothetical protein PQE68_gp046 [Bacillus phage vB_BanS_Sophrita]UGO50637.1 hypothetical protein SOPHRITA_46 [Bacillus phage vB_BanS_Sophrita]
MLFVDKCRECGKPIPEGETFCCDEHKESYLEYLNS